MDLKDKLIGNNMGEEEIAYTTLSIDEGFDNENAVPKGYHLHCFGCCCDFRKATMIANEICMGFSAIGFVFAMFGAFLISSGTDMFNMDDLQKELDDDQAIQNLSEMNAMMHDLSDEEIPTGVLFFTVASVYLIPFIFSAIGFYGAYKFKNWALITNAVFISLQLFAQFNAMRIASFPIVFAVPLALYLYPHVMMIHLVRKGIMTPSNYRQWKSAALKK